MTQVSDILEEIGKRVQEAWDLDEDHVLFDPRPSELPDTDPYAAIRFELTGGRFQAGAYDTVMLQVDIAAELTDPGAARSKDRLAFLASARDRLTPTMPALTVYPAIPGWIGPVMTDGMTKAVDDMPGLLLVGMSFQGEVSLPRGGYTG